MDIERIIAEDDVVVIPWSAIGTHAGTFNGYPATGRTATLHAISIVRMEHGPIVEGWQEADHLGMGQQIGMVPSCGIPATMAQVMSLRARLQDRGGRRGRN